MTRTFIAQNYISLSPPRTHSQVGSVAATVQFVNGSAVTLRLMVSEPPPPPPARLSVHLSVEPSSSEDLSTAAVCTQFLAAARPPQFSRALSEFWALNKEQRVADLLVRSLKVCARAAVGASGSFYA